MRTIGDTYTPRSARARIILLAVAAFNEPSIRNWRRFRNQEGCHTSRAQQRAVIARLGAHLAARGVTDTTIAAADEYSTEDMLKTLDAYEWTALSHLSRINTHSYCATRHADVRARGRCRQRAVDD